MSGGHPHAWIWGEGGSPVVVHGCRAEHDGGSRGTDGLLRMQTVTHHCLSGQTVSHTYRHVKSSQNDLPTPLHALITFVHQLFIPSGRFCASTVLKRRRVCAACSTGGSRQQVVGPVRHSCCFLLPGFASTSRRASCPGHGSRQVCRIWWWATPTAEPASSSSSSSHTLEAKLQQQTRPDRWCTGRQASLVPIHTFLQAPASTATQSPREGRHQQLLQLLLATPATRPTSSRLQEGQHQAAAA